MEFKVCGVSVRGRSHEIENSPCQDSIFYKSYKNKVFIALGDGAGSRKFSQIGSKVITNEICNILNKYFNLIYQLKVEDAQRFIVKKLWNSLQLKANEKNIDVNELSSTLMFMGISDCKVIIGHLGDGMICLKNKKGIEILSQSEEREFSNRTYFLSPKNEHRLILFKEDIRNLKDIDGFFLFTDGCENFLYSKRNNKINPILNEILEYTNKKSQKVMNKQLKNSLTSCIKQKLTFDDCSLGVLSLISKTKIVAIKKKIGNKYIYKKIS